MAFTQKDNKQKKLVQATEEYEAEFARAQKSFEKNKKEMQALMDKIKLRVIKESIKDK